MVMPSSPATDTEAVTPNASVRAASVAAARALERQKEVEEQARSRAAYLRGLLMKTQIRETTKAQSQRRQASAAQYKREVVHAERERLRDVPRASEAELTEMSVYFNHAMSRVIPDAAARLPFQLFTKMDSDGSGLVTLRELVRFVRSTLEDPPSRVAPDLLKRVFAALDEEGAWKVCPLGV